MNRVARQMMFASTLLLCAVPVRAEDTSDGNPDDAAAAESPQAQGRIRFGPFRMRDHRDFRNMITLSPGIEWFGSGGYGVRPEIVYHRLLPHRLALRSGLNLGLSNGGGVNLTNHSESDSVQRYTVDATSTSVGFHLGLDWYPVGNGMHGAFLGPRLKYSFGWGNYRGAGSDGLATTFDRLSVEAALGWRWVWDPGFSFGLGVLTGYVRRTVENNDRLPEGISRTYGNADDENWEWLIIDIELTFGWTF